MSKAEELLNSVYSVDNVALFANVQDEAHIVIDSDRQINVPNELKRLAVQYDHNIETVTFDCPRYWDDHDMSKMSIYINYLRVDEEIGVFLAENVTVDTSDSSIMHFDWTISRNVTEAVGKLVFLVCVKCIDKEGNEKNHWNSELCKDCYVSEGLEADSEELKELYTDIIEQWQAKVLSSLNEVNTVKDDLVKMRDSGELNGATFTPSASADGVLSWTNDRGMENPPAVNIRGTPGVSPTVKVDEVQGGHKVTFTDVNGPTSIVVHDTIVDSTEAVSKMMQDYIYVGSDEPELSPSLWFDTDATTSGGSTGGGNGFQSGSSANERVYCWGDSLTQGIGGNVNGWHLISYPAVLSERINTVNLGILSDDVPTIMARIGADPVILDNCVIPASSSESVVIGNTTTGLTLESGRIAKLLKYGDCGINPCYVNDVPCILFRDYSANSVDNLDIRLRRLTDGEAIGVSSGTKLVTFGSKHYRGNGLHIFWMGANGGYGSNESHSDLNFSDYLEQLQKCVEFVSPADYLIVYSRERKGYTTDENAEIAELQEKFFGHFVNLVPQLNDRGLLYAETTNWDGTRVNGVPTVLDSGDGCHFSFYGYMAIGKIIWEYVLSRLNRT